MATNTYTALNTTTVSGTTTNTVTFSSIPSGYTDLVLVSNAQMSGTGTSGTFRFNGDTASNYSFTYLTGNGTTASSGRQSNQTAGIWDSWVDRLSNTMFETDILHIQNYSNTTTYKTAIGRSNSSSTSEAFVNLWRSTAAINSITLFLTTGNFVAGTTFTLYGIAAASVGAKATGGIIYQDASYFYHVFSGSGTFTPSQSLTADMLVVAGGGGAQYGNRFGGGGGGGGVLAFTSESLTATGYTVTVGAGGSVSTTLATCKGSNSSFGALTAAVGGGGGATSGTNGATGGSGGGGGLGNSGGAGTSGQGYAGGNGLPSTPRSAGGGGGAGAVGSNATNTYGGNGGTGLTTSFINALGTATGYGQLVSGNYYYAGGGGGSAYPYNDGLLDGGTGGNGGGGRGANYNGGGGASSHNAGAGTANTGGGGGGDAWYGNGADGATGGSGVVIVRYAK